MYYLRTCVTFNYWTREFYRNGQITETNCIALRYDSNTIMKDCKNIFMRRSAIYILLMLGVTMGVAQSNLLLEEEFDLVLEDWFERSETLRSYVGVEAYCTNKRYRESVNLMLEALHHYDSIVIDRITDPLFIAMNDSKEQRKTLKDIHKMESEYGMKDFIGHMRTTCKDRTAIETDKEKLRNGMGLETYDGQILLLETDQHRYLNHIDKLVDRISDHLHVLHIED